MEAQVEDILRAADSSRFRREVLQLLSCTLLGVAGLVISLQLPGPYWNIVVFFVIGILGTVLLLMALHRGTFCAARSITIRGATVQVLSRDAGVSVMLLCCWLILMTSVAKDPSFSQFSFVFVMGYLLFQSIPDSIGDIVKALFRRPG